MSKRALLAVLFCLTFLLVIVPEAINNNRTMTPGHTGAPGENTCSAAGCHVSTPINNRGFFFININNRPATYDTSVAFYTFFVNVGSIPTSNKGFQITAVDANGFAAGRFSLTPNNNTELDTAANGRVYVSHDSASSTGAFVFRWKPTAYVGPVTFYAAGLGVNNDGGVMGDQTYLDTLVFMGQGQPANINANFSISSATVCVGDPVTFTNTSTGTITTYGWNFGSGATPPNSSAVGPHSVTYSTTGTKSITLTVSDGPLVDTETKTINVVAAPVADAGRNDTICRGESATLTATGGTTYAWSNGAGSGASVTVSPIATTTYTVTATSGTCTDTDTVIVFVNQLPVADAGPNDTVCFGQLSSLTATGGVDYEWSTGDQTATTSGVLPVVGSFPVYVTVTDANGCSAVDSARAVSLALPNVTVPDVTTCSTGTAVLDAGPGFASYSWSTGDATQTTTVSSSGSYSVTVTNADGCTAADTATATLLSSLVVTLNDTTICQGSSVTLDAGHPGADYQWSDNSTLQTLTVSAPGTYSVTVTDGACTGSDAAVVSLATLPSVGAGADDTICAGDATVIGNADSLDFVLVQFENFNACSLPAGWQANTLAGTEDWKFSLPNYGLNSNGTGAGSMNGSCLAHYNDDDAGSGAINRLELLSPSFDATAYSLLLANMDIHFREFQGSQFSIQVWDGAAYQNLAVFNSTINGPTWSDFQNLSFDLIPYANPNLHLRFFYDDLGGYEWWAGIDNFVVGGVAGGIYSWSPITGLADPNAPITTASPVTTTSYVLTANVNGCTKSDTVVVTVNTSPTVSLSGIGTSYCADVNNGFALTGTPSGGSFSGPGVGTNEFNPSVAGVGTHNIIYSYFDASLGCTGRDTIQVTVHPVPTPSFATITSHYCIDEPAFALVANPAGGTFSGTGVSGGQFNPAAAGAGAHTVTYNYTSPAGCGSTATIVYNVVDFTPTISGLGTGYCVSDNSTINLTGTPAGGTFSGPGVSGNTFNPATAGAGVHDVVYTYDSLLAYTVDTNCLFDTVPRLASAVAYSFIDDDDELSNAIPIGFNFNFFGQDYSQLKVSTNGFLTFDVASTDSEPSNQLLPDTDDPSNLVAFLWDDLELSEFEYFVSGTAPNRSFVINFDAFHYLSNRVVEAQVVLLETSNEIEIHCINCEPDDSAPSATQGIENANGTRAFVVAGRNDDEWTAVNQCIRFIPTSCAFTQIQSVNVSGVVVDVADTSICAGESITITASGTSSYVWNHGPTTAFITETPADTTVFIVTGTDGACITTDTAVVNVREAVVASLTGLNDTVCSGDLAITLTGTPAGGTFSGPGVTGSTFDPSQANANALNTITYSVTNAFGCSDTTGFDVYISPSPNAQFTLLDTAYCLSALPVTLTATPAGGTFSGPGISNGTFVPYFAGVGVHNLTYRVAIPGGCDAIDTVSITVYDLPVVTFDPIAQQYCAQSDSVQLVGTPAGGTFAGPGVSGEYFNPGTATTGGPYILTYTVTDGNGCSTTNVQLTEVVDNPVLQWIGLTSDYCVNGDTVTLQTTPGGGTFSGDGVSGNQFVPANAGAGEDTLSYTYTDNAGCEATISAVVTVHDVLPIGIDNLDSTYCVNEPYVILSAFPAGGVFSGNGVVGDVFSPDTSGTGGPYTITYTYTDTNGCVTSASATTRIKPAANLLLSGLDPEYCIEEDIDIPVNVAPAGGTLLGSGITGNNFNPSQAGFGNYILTYEYTNAEGCTSYTFYTVNVQACTGVGEVTANVQIGLYPNPTTGLLNFGVNGLDGQQVDVAVFSIHGQRLIKEQYNQVNSLQPLQLDMNALSVGTYLIQVQSGNYSSVHRVVISR